MKSRVTIRLNGEPREAEVHPGETLLHLLRTLGAKSVKSACEEGECGACAVELNGRVVNACLVFAGAVDGAEILTVEGLGTPQSPHPLQEAFADTGAVQCGYCTPGMILAAHALLRTNPDPDREEICTALDGNLCRCTGYVKIIEAVQKAAEMRKAKS
ncbi:MAG: (2Fe-2S)-binding protein [Planctomycetota bacterium]|jgi:carbon-monoxide dehydrogenase small subunit